VLEETEKTACVTREKWWGGSTKKTVGWPQRTGNGGPAASGALWIKRRGVSRPEK